jgi:transaldolase
MDTNLNQLEQIKKITTVVADTADFESIRVFTPQDATTNPSLVYAATQKENYSHFLEEVLAERRNSGFSGAAQLDSETDEILADYNRNVGSQTSSNRNITCRKSIDLQSDPSLATEYVPFHAV